MAAPKRKPPADPLAHALQRRDGLNCFLCGTKHKNLRSMSVGYVANKKDTEEAFLACITCNKRRDGKDLMAYLRERAIAADAELSYINTFMRPKSDYHPLQESLRVPIYIGDMSDPTAPVTTETAPTERRIQDVPLHEVIQMTWEEMKGLNLTPNSNAEEDFIGVLQFNAQKLSGDPALKTQPDLHIDDHGRVCLTNQYGEHYRFKWDQ